MPPNHPIPTSMVAWQINPGFLSAGPFAEKLKLNQVAGVPKLGKNQTLIKVLTAGVNPVDYKVGEMAFLARIALGSPASPGIDYVGRVWETTLANPHIKAGDLVFGKTEAFTAHGTLAQFTVITGPEGVVKAPTGVELDWFGGCGVAGLTAYQSLVPGVETQGEGSARGSSVFINGSSGGVGTFGVQIAKAIGCENIVVTCSASNAELVRGLGATEIIDYRSTNVIDALNTWVKNKNGGEKLDHIVDNSGQDYNLYWKSHQYLKEGGKYVLVGGAPNLHTFSNATKVMLIPSFLGGGQRKFELFAPKTSRKDFERMAQWMVEGKLKIQIDNTYSMDDALEAYKRLKTGRSRGKIVVRVSEDGR